MPVQRLFSVQSLWDLGLRGDKPYTDWPLAPESAIRVVGLVFACRHVVGVEVVFEYERSLWRVTVTFPDGDYDSNELNLPEEEDRVSYLLSATQVVAVESVSYVEASEAR